MKSEKLSEWAKRRGGTQKPTNDAIYTAQIAGLLSVGKTVTEIARQLNLGYSTVKRISQKDECKAIFREITNSYKESAKAIASKAVSEMTELAVEGLKKALKEGNVQAINTHFKVIGLLGVEDEAAKDKGVQSLTVVLPGATVEAPAIEVESSDVEFKLEAPDVGEVDVRPDQEGSDDIRE